MVGCSGSLGGNGISVADQQEDVTNLNSPTNKKTTKEKKKNKLGN
jgi:hypothetical protein